MKNIILQTPSKPGVLPRKTFSHTPDEARSVGLAKACVLQKNLFCYREIRFMNTDNLCFVKRVNGEKSKHTCKQTGNIGTTPKAKGNLEGKETYHDPAVRPNA